MAVEGTTVLISIDTRFEAFPFPRDIQWTKDGMAVNNSSMITFGYPSIRFQRISREDSGNYTLRATNYRIDDPNVEVGTALGRIKLDILCKHQSMFPPWEQKMNFGMFDIRCVYSQWIN